MSNCGTPRGAMLLSLLLGLIGVAPRPAHASRSRTEDSPLQQADGLWANEDGSPPVLRADGRTLARHHSVKGSPDRSIMSSQGFAESTSSFDAELDRRGPWSVDWTNSIAMCAIMKQENDTDIVEWLEHYKWLGVDRIFLTENEDPPPRRPALQPYIRSGFVDYSVEGTPHAQLMVYNRCIEEHGDEYDWMAFFDIDEFLLVRQRRILKGLLDEYKMYPGLVVHWVFFGSSGRKTRPEEGGVLESYTYCNPRPKPKFKTIANMFYTHSVKFHAHGMFYKGHAHPVNDARTPAPHRIGAPSSGCGTEVTEECPLCPGLYTMPPSVDRIALLHYAIKSQEDFDQKKTRGGGTRAVNRTSEYFDEHDREAYTDGGICAEGALQARMRHLAAGKAL